MLSFFTISVLTGLLVDQTDLNKVQTIVRSRLGCWGMGSGDIPEASALSEGAHPNGGPRPSFE